MGCHFLHQGSSQPRDRSCVSCVGRQSLNHWQAVSFFTPEPSVLHQITTYSEYSLGGLMLKLKLQYFGHLMWKADSLERPWFWEDWRQEKGTIEDEMVGRHHWLDRHEFEQAFGDGEGQGSLVKDREAWRATVHGVAKSQTWLSDWTTTGRRRKYCETCLSVLGQGWCAWCLFIRAGC